MLDRATANHDQVDANTQDGHRSHDPELTQAVSPRRMKRPVELMQPAQRSPRARSSRTLAGQSRNRGLVAPDTAVASAVVMHDEGGRRGQFRTPQLNSSVGSVRSRVTRYLSTVRATSAGSVIVTTRLRWPTAFG